MTETELKKEIARIRGRYTVIAAVITTLGVIVAAVIQFYAVVVPLREQNTALQKQNDALVEDSQEAEGETSTMQDTISALETRISDLEGTIADLRDENSNLQSQYETVQSDYASAISEIDTLRAENNQLKEQQSNIDNLSEPNQSNDLQEAGEWLDLMKVCPPYDFRHGSDYGYPFYDAPEKISVMGLSYKNAFCLSGGCDSSYAFFNLNQQYHTLEFDIGHVDETSMYARNLRIVLDGDSYIDAFELQPDMLLTHFSIPVANIKQMKVYVERGAKQGTYCPIYAFVNGKLS